MGRLSGFSRYLYNQYTITKDTHIVINGDAAPWIRSGVDYFENAIYTYDRYHLKKWIKQALNKRSKAEFRKAYLAADGNDPVALLVAVAEAEKAETDEEKKAAIGDLRQFILENQEALRDYRELLQEKGADTTGMRMMGSAESNMNLFSKRLKKMGYSWSYNGLCGMVSGMIHKWEGTLVDALRGSVTDETKEKPIESYPSFAKLLTEKTGKAIGAIKGHIPALNSKDQGKPYIQALRGLSGLQ